MQKFLPAVTTLLQTWSQLHFFYFFLHIHKKHTRAFSVFACWLGLGDLLVVWAILKRVVCVCVRKMCGFLALLPLQDINKLLPSGVFLEALGWFRSPAEPPPGYMHLDSKSPVAGFEIPQGGYQRGSLHLRMREGGWTSEWHPSVSVLKPFKNLWKSGDESNQTQPYSEAKTPADYDSRHCFHR